VEIIHKAPEEITDEIHVARIALDRLWRRFKLSRGAGNKAYTEQQNDHATN